MISAGLVFLKLIIIALLLMLVMQTSLSAEAVQSNPHWKKTACTSCHTINKPTKGNRALKIKNTDKLCKSCHKKTKEHDYLHLVDIAPSKKMQKIMPAKIRATLSGKGKKMTCSSCHETIMQCTPSLFSERYGNSAFLRGKNPHKRYVFCYQCHDEKAYQKLNPHDQKSDDGKVYRNKCLICHLKAPQQQGSSKVSNIKLQVKSNWEQLCKNCHRVPLHPGENTNHIVKPSKKVLQRLKKMTVKNNIMFPLEPKTGRIYCATCHNPHERGIIKNKLAAKGADEKHRLRSNYVCDNCHDI